MSEMAGIIRCKGDAMGSCAVQESSIKKFHKKFSLGVFAVNTEEEKIVYTSLGRPNGGRGRNLALVEGVLFQCRELPPLKTEKRTPPMATMALSHL
jgi:hypothetical protein